MRADFTGLTEHVCTRIALGIPKRTDGWTGRRNIDTKFTEIFIVLDRDRKLSFEPRHLVPEKAGRNTWARDLHCPSLPRSHSTSNESLHDHVDRPETDTPNGRVTEHSSLLRSRLCFFFVCVVSRPALAAGVCLVLCVSLCVHTPRDGSTSTL